MDVTFFQRKNNSVNRAHGFKCGKSVNLNMVIPLIYELHHPAKKHILQITFGVNTSLHVFTALISLYFFESFQRNRLNSIPW